MPIIELSNKKQILVQENDFPNPLKWEDAINFCQNTKGNWRVPTIEELVVLHEKKNIPTNDYGYWNYWSSNIENGEISILEGPTGNISKSKSKDDECYLKLVSDDINK